VAQSGESGAMAGAHLELSQTSCEGFRKRLDRRRNDFMNCMKLLDQ